MRRKEDEKKKMSLFDKKWSGEAQFFSSGRVATVWEQAQEIEAENQHQKTLTEETKLQWALAKEQKTAEVQKWKKEWIQTQREKCEQIEHEKMQHQAQKLVEKQLREKKKAQNKQVKIKKAQSKQIREEEKEQSSKCQIVEVSCSERQIKLSLWFQK